MVMIQIEPCETQITKSQIKSNFFEALNLQFESLQIFWCQYSGSLENGDSQMNPHFYKCLKNTNPATLD